MTRINLLPWREERNARRRTGFLIFLVGMAGAALGTIWLADQVIDQAIDRQVARNNHLSKDISVLDSRIKAIGQLQEQSQQLTERMKVVQTLQDDRSVGGRLLNQLVRAVPEGVQLQDMVVENGSIRISGTAESNHDIARLMRGLEAAEGMQAPRLLQVQGEQEGGNGFQMMVRQEESGGARQ
ncbi:fimbriae biosynthesis protein [Pseudomonas sp. CCM 7891]|uniref:Fimbriae biosynthesis protein n=1 Tax=Pseudomonas karstica TaxID=1055468 RepID=A0A7X2UY02_9PSED|nr:PilN domain-containing protein [Pseudomonas karstica]MTD18570.1 fimbriae biosynthesis protein [Pseudomonas karstica]